MIAIPIVLAIIVVLVIWFLYLMGHPNPKEPRFIYNFRRHPSAIPEYIALIGYGLFQPRLLRTGATGLEKKQDLPGDELIRQPQLQETRATTINVPVSHLWPWIVQIGAGRAGYYWWTPGEAFPEYAAYITNTYDVLPQFQQLNVGDRISDGGPYSSEERGNWIVKSIEPDHFLVLYAARQVSKGPDFDRRIVKPKGIWFMSSWAFVLEPLGTEKTRLLVRVRATAGPAWIRWMVNLILGKGDRVAHNSMFERLKTRAEAKYSKQLARSTSVS